MFVGERVRLTAMRPEDVPVVTRWYEDSEFSRMFDSRIAYPRTENRMRGWVTDSSDGKEAFMFGIRPVDDEALIGIIDLDGIAWNHRSAWMSVAIGDMDNRGKGYGREAIQLMLRFAFRELNLHRVQLTVFSYNTRAIRLYESLGFVREGVQRESLLREGQWHDTYNYAILEQEWRAMNNAR